MFFAYRGSKERGSSRAHTRAPTAIFNFLLSQPSQNSLYNNYIQMITALLGTKFVKQTENIAKRCSTNAQKLGNSSIHEPDSEHGILTVKATLL